MSDKPEIKKPVKFINGFAEGGYVKDMNWGPAGMVSGPKIQIDGNWYDEASLAEALKECRIDREAECTAIGKAKLKVIAQRYADLIDSEDEDSLNEARDIYLDEVGNVSVTLDLLAEIDRLRTAEGDAMTYKAGMENVAQQRDQLKAEVEESAAVIDQLAKILAGVAVALKGEELPLSRHGYHDLVEGVSVLKLENDLRKAENEALRKDLVDWQEVVVALKREVPERFTSHARGNAPGHGHSISGVWDDDNGALAGKECAWCKAWNAAMSKAAQ